MMVYLKERSEDVVWGVYIVEVRMGRWLSYAICSCADLGTETRGRDAIVSSHAAVGAC